MLEVITKLNWTEVIVAVNAVLVAGIAIASLIPGEQPEKFLKSVVDLISKFSKK
jgi:hypothetical protein